jgi:hypothetical protein
MFTQDHLLLIYDNNQHYKDCLLSITCWLLMMTIISIIIRLFTLSAGCHSSLSILARKNVKMVLIFVCLRCYVLSILFFKFIHFPLLVYCMYVFQSNDSCYLFSLLT